MPYKVTLENLPAGIALTAARKGEKVRVGFRGFLSSEDGDLFIQQLEGFPGDVLARLPQEARISASMLDHMLVVINNDRVATVYTNELSFLLKIRAKRSIKKGEAVYQDDIADIQGLGLGNISIPASAGILFLFSIGWRKGLFFDFGSLHTPPILRDYDLETLLGYYYGYLGYQHLFKITEEEWQLIFEQQWFPFITLKNSTIRTILSHVRNQWSIDDLLGTIANEASASLESMIDRWSGKPILQPHIELIRHAVDRYTQKDFVSATSILYTRIEGIMRSIHLKIGSGKKASPKNLVESVTGPQELKGHENSLLLPHMFRKYLEQVYFHDFKPEQPIKLSRHSVAHGIATPADFSLKAATIGLLIIDQIFYFLPTESAQDVQSANNDVVPISDSQKE